MVDAEPMGDYVDIAEPRPWVVTLRGSGRATDVAFRVRWRRWWQNCFWRLRRVSGADVLTRIAAAFHPALATLLVALVTVFAGLIGLWGWIWITALKATALRLSRGGTTLPCEETLLNYYMLVDLCFNLLPMALVCVPEVYQRWGLVLSLPLPLAWTVVGVAVVWRGPPCGGKRDVDLFGSVRPYVYLAALGYLLAGLGYALAMLDEVSGNNFLARLYWNIALEPATPAPPLLSPEEALAGCRASSDCHDLVHRMGCPGCRQFPLNSKTRTASSVLATLPLVPSLQCGRYVAIIGTNNVLLIGVVAD